MIFSSVSLLRGWGKHDHDCGTQPVLCLMHGKRSGKPTARPPLTKISVTVSPFYPRFSMPLLYRGKLTQESLWAAEVRRACRCACRVLMLCAAIILVFASTTHKGHWRKNHSNGRGAHYCPCKLVATHIFWVNFKMESVTIVLNSEQKKWKAQSIVLLITILLYYHRIIITIPKLPLYVNY